MTEDEWRWISTFSCFLFCFQFVCWLDVSRSLDVGLMQQQQRDKNRPPSLANTVSSLISSTMMSVNSDQSISHTPRCTTQTSKVKRQRNKTTDSVHDCGCYYLYKTCWGHVSTLILLENSVVILNNTPTVNEMGKLDEKISDAWQQQKRSGDNINDSNFITYSIT